MCGEFPAAHNKALSVARAADLPQAWCHNAYGWAKQGCLWALEHHTGVAPWH